ncbi:MAG: hypothetical protein DRP09_08810 [Candidatus Thorarchaeota archaeon]|nr:MAG: hypothetical protein DRP09_08810 [Candidatus Thorarchaeota archaeon]
MKRKVANLGLSLIGPVVLIILLTMPIGPLAGGLGILQPVGGIFDVGKGVTHPDTERVYVPGVQSETRIIVDEWGIPHIYGQTIEDAFFGLGYMHARDRLFQMVMQNYLAAGRISEVIGGMGYAIESDKFQRSIGLARAAEATYRWYVDNAATNPDVNYSLRAINAHVAGVNAFINSMTSENTPIEFKILGFTPEPWTPVDTFIWAKMMTWGLSGGVRDLYREMIRAKIQNSTMYSEMFPDYWPYTVPIIPEQYNLSLSEYDDAPGGYPASVVPPAVPAAAEAQTDLIPQEKLDRILSVLSSVIDFFGPMEVVGSNSWAVNGSMTSTGEAILANDPHLSLQAPSLWYEAHIVVPGVLNVQGGTLPGTPGVLIGHTANISWGMTNVGADVLDIFVEQVEPANHPGQYFYNGEWRDFEIVDEPIHVKGGATIDFNVSWSVHGPCIDSVVPTFSLDEYSTPNLSMNWTGLSVTHEILSLGILNRANNLTDYFDAMYWWDSPPHNFIYADTEGNIAITVAGRFPIRSGYSGYFPVQATNDSVGMVSNIPYAFNPRSVNPSQCYLQSANQKSIDPSTYGFTILGAQDPGYRGRRINELLDAVTTVTAEDMMRFHADVLDVSAREILPYVLAAWSAVGSNASVQIMVDELVGWDYRMEVDVAAPTIWTVLMDELRDVIFDEATDLGVSAGSIGLPVVEWMLKENITHYFDDQSTPGVESRDDILVVALEHTLATLTADFGPSVDDWIYGDRHTIYIGHLAGLTYIGGGAHRGGRYTLNVGWSWEVRGGPSRRMVVDYGTSPDYYVTYPGGQSQNMFSPHWDDLFDLWYAFDTVTEHYGYYLEYNFTTAALFEGADDGTMIEYALVLLPRS